MTLADIQREAHETAVEKGWYERERPPLELLMLITTEVAECAEEWRKPDVQLEAVAEELADVVIRCADAAAYWQVDLAQAVRGKMSRNRSRPTRHGGKRF
jgi:NTP pyrophosphatase (non-canonical NTP hydrolase)